MQLHFGSHFHIRVSIYGSGTPDTASQVKVAQAVLGDFQTGVTCGRGTVSNDGRSISFSCENENDHQVQWAYESYSSGKQLEGYTITLSVEKQDQ